jgi:hypothetical protein
MKKLIVALVLCFTAVSARAEGWKELFKETEDKWIDFAVASSVEGVYYRDLIGGRNAIGAQFPIVYVAKVLSADFGYVAAYEDSQRGSLAFGGSIRVNQLLQEAFPDKVNSIKDSFPLIGKMWDKLFFGPYISHSFGESELQAGVKAGLSW